MDTIRTIREGPSSSDVIGTTRFVGALNRAVLFKNGQAVQAANLGNVKSVTTTYQILPSDGFILAGNTTSYTVTLPAVATVVKGFQIIIKKTGASGTLTIDGSGDETIDGSANVQTSTQHDVLVLICDGSNWQRVNLAGTAAQQAAAATSISSAGSVTSAQTRVILTGTSTYNLALPLPAAATGITFWFKKTGASGVVTLTTPGAETIDGANSLDITEQYRAVSLYSDGTNWHMLANSTPAAG